MNILHFFSIVVSELVKVSFIKLFRFLDSIVSVVLVAMSASNHNLYFCTYDHTCI